MERLESAAALSTHQIVVAKQIALALSPEEATRVRQGADCAVVYECGVRMTPHCPALTALVVALLP